MKFTVTDATARTNESTIVHHWSSEDHFGRFGFSIATWDTLFDLHDLSRPAGETFVGSFPAFQEAVRAADEWDDARR